MTDLWPHQREAVQKIQPLGSGMLAMDMGCGKTRTSLELLSRWDCRRVLPTAADIVAACCRRHNLPTTAVRFHREFAAKSCPGTGIDLAAFRVLVQARLAGEVDNAAEVLIIEGLGETPDAVIRANARVEGGVLRADVRALLEGMGYRVLAHQLAAQGKIYVTR